MNDREQATAINTLLESGDILKSRYRILQQLGHGGFGRTFLAEDINRFNEYCVLKEFAPQLQGLFALEKGEELFEKEAGVLYRLQHPQIPKFRELFRYQQENQGRLLLVQDYVEGQTYHALLNERLHSARKVTETEIEHLLAKILPVLAYIHSMGIIHRDISPDNIILRSADQLPMLIDFGSIKEVEQKAQSQLIETTPNNKLSLIGTAIGKSGYAPPEQTERGVVFAHSDLYGLAATAVVLLTGKQPQQLLEPESYWWNWQSEVILSSKLTWILSTMLNPNPSDRFSSAAEVIETLQEISALSFSPQTAATTVNTSQSVNHQPQTKIKSLIDFIPQLLFWIPFSVVLILSGFLCLKAQNLAVLNSESADPIASVAKSQLQERFSQGEKALIPQVTTPEKQLAIAAFAQGKYQEATSLFTASLDIFANDPEALIYLNNAQIAENKAYSIAVSVPIGSDVNTAQEILRGVAQAQTLVNQAGGINNVPLKVQIINDDNEPAIAKQVATTLSQNREVLGVVGHGASDVTLAAAQIYQTSQLVAISPISTSVKLSNLSPYLFRTVPSDYIAARALAQYMLENLNQKNVAVFYSSQSNYSKSLQSEFMTAVSLGGGQVVNTFDLSDPNFSATDRWQQAVDRGADVIMLAANTATLDKALQVVEVNRQRLTLLAGDDVYTPKTLEIAGESAKDMVIPIPWHIKNNPDGDFIQAAKEFWGGEVNWRTAMAYDAAQALITAIARHPTRIGVQKNLTMSNFTADGANSPINFLPSGDRLKPIELVKIQPSDRPHSSYQFMPIVSEVNQE